METAGPSLTAPSSLLSTCEDQGHPGSTEHPFSRHHVLFTHHVPTHGTCYVKGTTRLRPRTASAGQLYSLPYRRWSWDLNSPKYNSLPADLFPPLPSDPYIQVLVHSEHVLTPRPLSHSSQKASVTPWPQPIYPPSLLSAAAHYPRALWSQSLPPPDLLPGLPAPAARRTRETC